MKSQGVDIDLTDDNYDDIMLLTLSFYLIQKNSIRLPMTRIGFLQKDLVDRFLKNFLFMALNKLSRKMFSNLFMYSSLRAVADLRRRHLGMCPSNLYFCKRLTREFH